MVDLSYMGSSDNSIVMRVPRERLLFALNSYAFRGAPDPYVPDWIESLVMPRTLHKDSRGWRRRAGQGSLSSQS